MAATRLPLDSSVARHWWVGDEASCPWKASCRAGDAAKSVTNKNPASATRAVDCIASRGRGPQTRLTDRLPRRRDAGCTGLVGSCCKAIAIKHGTSPGASQILHRITRHLADRSPPREPWRLRSGLVYPRLPGRLITGAPAIGADPEEFQAVFAVCVPMTVSARRPCAEAVVDHQVRTRNVPRLIASQEHDRRRYLVRLRKPLFLDQRLERGVLTTRRRDLLGP